MLPEEPTLFTQGSTGFNGSISFNYTMSKNTEAYTDLLNTKNKLFEFLTKDFIRNYSEADLPDRGFGSSLACTRSIEGEIIPLADIDQKKLELVEIAREIENTKSKLERSEAIDTINTLSKRHSITSDEVSLYEAVTYDEEDYDE